MATAALGGVYVLSDKGASELAAMVSKGSAPVSSPGFTSQLGDASTSSGRLSELDRLARRASSAKR
ncbi:hypothetical protein [Agromyces larvae]|uniref:Uncharacterized protein n=1 Tax=Agromyces larvae TaxID=2929802 RepID=A0ABY4BV45_9MICO|nr:hypothetical protein [Agromyces larvae]UOE43085.1 hypothetical protein MTO99_12910 [Agromyces larvae]